MKKKLKTKKSASAMEYKLVAIPVADAFPRSKWAQQKELKGYKALIPAAGDPSDKRYTKARRRNLRHILELAKPPIKPNWRKLDLPVVVRVTSHETEITRMRGTGEVLSVRKGKKESTLVRIIDLIVLGLAGAIRKAKYNDAFKNAEFVKGFEEIDETMADDEFECEFEFENGIDNTDLQLELSTSTSTDFWPDESYEELYEE